MVVVKSPELAEPPGAGPDQAEPGRRGRQPAQARSRETVERILDAAAVLIEEGSVGALTTRTIAERGDVVALWLIAGHLAGRVLVADATITHLIDAAGARAGRVTFTQPRQDGV